MKSIKTLTLALLLVIVLLAGCAQVPANSSAPASSEPAPESQSSVQESEAPEAPTESKGKIVVGATPTPHAEILAVVKPLLSEQGYELEIREFTDYVQPNMTLDTGDLDANYFQHKPYLDDFNTNNGTHLVSLVNVHYEPFGIYPGKTATLDALPDGAQIAVPNDGTNEARALLLLEAQGLINVREDAGLEATINDITENPKNLEIVELEAAQTAISLPDVDVAVINGNYALQAGLNAETDTIAKEDKESLAATTFANILAIRAGDENREDLKALAAALNSEEVRAYIEATYGGAVVPTF
jgi:D-methionine transport system substrate-binding protein